MPDDIKHRTVATFREAKMVATIRENEGAKGPWYSVTLARIFVDENGRERRAVTMGRDDLLPAASLLKKAREWMAAASGRKERTQ